MFDIAVVVTIERHYCISLLRSPACNRNSAAAAEIQPELIAKAKQEGQVTYYTDLIVDQVVRPMTAAFEKKYGIKVSFVAATAR